MMTKLIRIVCAFVVVSFLMLQGCETTTLNALDTGSNLAEAAATLSEAKRQQGYYNAWEADRERAKQAEQARQRQIQANQARQNQVNYQRMVNNWNQQYGNQPHYTYYPNGTRKLR